MSKIMDDLRAEVAEIKGAAASAVAFIAGLRQRLADALNSDNDTDGEIQSIIDELNGSEAALATAIAEDGSGEAPGADAANDASAPAADATTIGSEDVGSMPPGVAGDE